MTAMGGSVANALAVEERAEGRLGYRSGHRCGGKSILFAESNFDGKREPTMPWRAVLERRALQFVNSLAAFQR